MSYLGDTTPGKTIWDKFCSHTTAGAPITLAGSPVVSIYKDASTTESTAGVTLTVDFDGRTGLHMVAIDTSADGTFYSAGSDFEVVLTAGSVDGQSVAGTKLFKFSLANRSALRPTTADRTLDVSAGGEAGVDWANVGGPTTTVNLSGTTVKAVTDRVTANADQISGDATAADNAEAFFDGTGYAGTGNTIPTVTTLTNAPADSSGTTTLLSRLTSGRATNLDNLDAAVSTRLATAGYTAPDNATILARLPAALVGGRMDASVGAMAVDVLTAAAIATDAFGALELAAGAATEIAAAISASGIALSAAGLDAVLVESGLNVRQAISILLATESGVSSGAVPGIASTITFLGAGVGTTRVVSDCDSAGNRTSVTLSPPA